MDKNEKLAAARKKLRRYQAHNTPRAEVVRSSLTLGGEEWTAASMPTLSLKPPSSYTETPATSEIPAPSTAKNAKLSATEGLREMSQEISNILSRSALSTTSTEGLTVPDHSHPSVPDHPMVNHYGNSMTTLVSTPSENTLEKQIQVHAQTIDILVGEKSALQTELSTMETQLRNKKRECSELTSHLQATRVKLEEIEREKLNISQEMTRKEKALSHTSEQSGDMKRTVDQLRSSLEDQQQENTELISKITSQAAEMNRLQTNNTELQSKLNMAELLAQQLSAGAPLDATPPSGPSPSQTEMEDLRLELDRVRGSVQQITSERDQALSDLSALKDTMVTQQRETARKVAELQGRLAEAEVNATSLSQELESVQLERDSLLEKVSSEHAQLQQSSQVAMETLQQERDELKQQHQHQIQDNAQLNRLNTEMEERISELELELSRVKERVVDQQSLLTTISQDKETISRAMSQNKELKLNLTELQDAFVKLSQQNMDLASDLETERHRARQLQRMTETTGGDTPSGEDTPSGGEVDMVEANVQVQQPAVESPVQPAEESPATVQPTEESPATVQPAEDHSEEEKQQIQALKLERETLQDQLHRLQQEHMELEGEHKKVLHQLTEARKTEDDGFIGQQLDVHNMSVEELTTLQNSFNGLQQRFMAVMGEKAELLDRLQEEEHRIIQLSGETETIGEYISLYQTQREALREKFHEKDVFIQQLITEKTTFEAKLHELQALMRQLLSERPHKHHPATTSSLPHHPATTSSSSLPHTSDIPLHLRPQTYDDHAHVTPVAESLSALEETEQLPQETADQIIQLLDQLGSGELSSDVMMPCPCCTGQLVVV